MLTLTTHGGRAIQTCVDRSDVLIVFLTGQSSRTSSGNLVETSDYFASINCLREFRRAVARGMPMVIVQETDPSQCATASNSGPEGRSSSALLTSHARPFLLACNSGHVPLAVHRDACPPELRHALDELVLVPWY